MGEFIYLSYIYMYMYNTTPSILVIHSKKEELSQQFMSQQSKTNSNAEPHIDKLNKPRGVVN